MTVKNKKKILIVTDFYKPHISGITTYINSLTNILAKNNYQITILTGKFSKELSDIEINKNLKIIRAKPLFKFSRGFYSFDLIKKYLVEKENHDYVNIHYPLTEIFPLIFFSKKKLILNYHCIPDYKSIFLKFISLYFYSFGFLSMIFSNRISIFCEDYFYSFFAHNFFRKKVEIIPPFVDIIPNLNNNIPNLNNNKLIIGFLGRVCVEKGIENLIEASFILEKKRIKHLVNIAGDIKDVRFASYVKKILTKTKNSPNIKFIGKLKESQKRTFFSSLNVFVLPSINSFEAFGIVQLEAMAHGIPVIASDLKGVRIPIKFTKNGYIFQKGNSIELANYIIKINNSKSLFIKKEIQDKCLLHFNEKEFTKKSLSLFN
ncbi:MAG: hypothetical protein CMI58_02800 [Parcubacteria group bacterium]|nr:hypothetical protein [Parcubacteria group bacterium]